MKIKHKETYKPPNIHQDKKEIKIKKAASVKNRHRHKIKTKQTKPGRKIFHEYFLK